MLKTNHSWKKLQHWFSISILVPTDWYMKIWRKKFPNGKNSVDCNSWESAHRLIWSKYDSKWWNLVILAWRNNRIWSTKFADRAMNQTIATLLDTGNLVHLKKGNESHIEWNFQSSIRYFNFRNECWAELKNTIKLLSIANKKSKDCTSKVVGRTVHYTLLVKTITIAHDPACWHFLLFKWI